MTIALSTHRLLAIQEALHQALASGNADKSTIDRDAYTGALRWANQHLNRRSQRQPKETKPDATLSIPRRLSGV